MRMEFRIGINVGDIIVDDDNDIFGDGVNVAARLEALAEPDRSGGLRRPVCAKPSGTTTEERSAL